MILLHRKKTGLFWISGLLMLLCSAALSCSLVGEKEGVTFPVIRVGVLPDQGTESLKNRYGPLLDYLSRETTLQYELIIPKTYEGLMDDFAEKRIDMAWFGGVSFVKAHHQYSATPLVMRDIDLRFSSYFLVKSSHPAKTLAEFEGKKFGFGSKLSTSGHIMPRYFLEEKGMNPETFFAETRYSGKHDKTAFWVRDGEVDLGAANAKVIDKMFADGRLAKKDVRVIWETPNYPDYVWAVQPFAPKAVQIKIRDAFLNLDPNNEEHHRIMALMNAGYFLPAHSNEFINIKTVLDKLGMLG